MDTGSTWHLNPYAIGPLGCFGAAVLLSALIYGRAGAALPGGARVRTGRATFAPLAVVAGIWNLGVAAVLSTTDDAVALALSRAAVSVILFSGTAACWFIVDLSRARFAWWDFARARHRRAILAAGLVASGASTLMLWLDPQVLPRVVEPPWGGRYPVAGPHLPIAVAPTVALLGLSIAIALGARRRLAPSRRRRQIGYVAISYVAGTFGAIDLGALYGAELPPIGWATSLLSIAIVYHAMARWRLMDIRTAFHRTVFWAVAIAATFAPIYALARATAGWSGWSSFWPRAVAIVTALALLRVYVVAVEGGIARLLDRRRRGQARAIAKFEAAALAARRPKDLLGPLDEALREVAGVGLVAVGFSVDPVADPMHEGSTEPAADAPRDRPYTYWHGDARREGVDALPATLLPGEPIARDELDPDGGSVRESLDAHGGDLLVPMRHRGRPVGAVIARGAAISLDDPTREALDRLAARAAVAFTNAALYDEVERRSAGLEVAVEERTEELARALAELKSAQASLVQAEKQSALGLLVAGVSHEINNALNFIYGNLPTLQKYLRVYDELAERAGRAGAVIPDELRDAAARGRPELDAAIDQVGEAARRARQIVDDLRRFARHDEAERKAADVREGLDSTINLLAPGISGRVALERAYDPDVPLIECFPAALNHVFLNVLLNAAQAIPERGTVSLAVRRLGDDAVEIRVADTGHGIAAGDLPRLFEPFFTTKRRAAGLGLTVSRQIVQRHGGSITVEPNPGGAGALVTIALPLRAPAAAVAAAV